MLASTVVGIVPACVDPPLEGLKFAREGFGIAQAMSDFEPTALECRHEGSDQDALGHPPQIAVEGY